MIDHLVTVEYALITAFIGAYLGALYLTSGNLLVPIVTHAVYDFLALFYLFRLSSLPAEHAENTAE